MSTNRGLPADILSNLDIKFIAPDRVLGGKNSKEKNLSLDSIRDLILSFRVVSKVPKRLGEAEREVSGEFEFELSAEFIMSKSKGE